MKFTILQHNRIFSNPPIKTKIKKKKTAPERKAVPKKKVAPEKMLVKKKIGSKKTANKQVLKAGDKES